MTMRLPASLRFTVPLILLVFAATLTAVNILYHVPQAQRAAEEESRKRMAQEMSRLQSTLEYFLLKGDVTGAQHEVAVLAHSHDVVLAALTDDRKQVIAATHRAWLERPVSDVLPQFDLDQVEGAIRAHRAGMSISANGSELLGYAGILMGSEREELRPSRIGGLFLAYDLGRYKAEARAHVLQQSLYWAGWVTVLALGMWLAFHFLLTRRTARLVQAAEEIASGNLAARSRLKGTDELGRLSRSFDAMALKVADTQIRLHQDIAGRKMAEAALRASEEQYHAMFDASIDGLALWNAAGDLVDTNPALCRMYGYEDDEFCRSPGGWPGPSYQEEFLQAVAAGEPLHVEVTERRKDGSALELELHGIPMQYQGKPHVLTIARDITEKKRSATELERQRDALYQREKLAALGSLLAGVAHELNNPLSVVVARAVLLEEQGDAKTKAAALKIRTAAERCARIVRTFLAMARQQRPERGPVAVNEVVKEALDITSYATRTSSVDMEVDLAEGIPPILADADQLHQVLLNLIINAQQSLQEQPPPRRIRITSCYDYLYDMVQITVADNGPGIPAHLRARVFEPYFTTKPTGTGTGVGLAVSLGIVEAHGGALAVACPTEGGAVFTITLPVGVVDAAKAAKEPPQKAIPSRRSILVVDDEAEIRDTLSEILNGALHRVVTASSGREALERMAAETFDVILTDIRMPDLDGRALYEEIRRRWPDRCARVVFVTGDTLASALREFVSESGRPVIEKPFLPSEVRRIVAELVANGELAPPG
ncbi:MAG TPA: ATP-binding protein [Casimicrobiaceae bacterium]|nr:ATP-binding protein [Casimicrobiaceae bacterium]